MSERTRRLLWFVGLYVVSAALFAGAVYGLRFVLGFGQG